MRFGWVIGAFGLMTMAACGPIQATTGIIRAEEELRTAKLMEADRLAPYEYTKSDLMLKMAKERQGFSEFEAAKTFADEALRYAVMAKQNVPRNIRQQMQKSPAAGGVR